MKIVFGKTTEDFHIYDDEGKEITGTLAIKELSFTLGKQQQTVVRLTCYADSIEFLETLVDVTIVKD